MTRLLGLWEFRGGGIQPRCRRDHDRDPPGHCGTRETVPDGSASEGGVDVIETKGVPESTRRTTGDGSSRVKRPRTGKDSKSGVDSIVETSQWAQLTNSIGDQPEMSWVK